MCILEVKQAFSYSKSGNYKLLSVWHCSFEQFVNKCLPISLTLYIQAEFVFPLQVSEPFLVSFLALSQLGLLELICAFCHLLICCFSSIISPCHSCCYLNLAANYSAYRCLFTKETRPACLRSPRWTVISTWSCLFEGETSKLHCHYI